MDPATRAALAAFLAEDLGRGDATTAATVPEDASAVAVLLARSDVVTSGISYAGEIFRLLDGASLWSAFVADGDAVPPGTRLAEVSGSARAILSAERTVLNLLQRMAGIAAVTRRLVEAVSGTPCQVLDTRKTAPGLRAFDKKAVADGGGRNHRFGLDDGILIKDNHIRLCGGVVAAVAAARARACAMLRIEVEVESEAQLREALDAGADIVLLDNRSPEEVARLVAIARALSPRVLLEASGGITEGNARAYAAAGVDFISVGALTHSAPAADISLEIEVA